MPAEPVNRPAAPPVVLLDRDGTVIEDPGYLGDPDGLRFLPGAVAGLRRLAGAGCRLVVITNQSGIGRGLITEAQVEAVHRRLREELARQGIRLSGIYYCPHRPEEGCACRKPGTALVRRAERELGFDAREAVVVGDKGSDLQLARALGVPGFLVLTGDGRATAEASPGLADYVVPDLAAAAELLMMTDDRISSIRQSMHQSADAIRATADASAGEIARAVELIVGCYRKGGKLLLCGNGGSAAQCQHLAAELVNLLSRDRPRPPLAAIALTTDTSLLTAIANDSGFEEVFARQVAALGRQGDLLLAISTSGESPNVLEAMDQARETGMGVILLTGKGGAAASHADLAIRAGGESAQQVQEVHAAIGHALCAEVERAVFGRGSGR